MPGFSIAGNTVICKKTMNKPKASDLKQPVQYQKFSTLCRKSEHVISRGNGFPKSQVGCLGFLESVYEAAQATTGLRNADPKQDSQGNFLSSGNGLGNLAGGHSVKSLSFLPLVSQEITSRKKTSTKNCRSNALPRQCCSRHG